MPDNLKYYSTVAQEMIEGDRQRDANFIAYEKMWHNDWDLPEGLKTLQWVLKYISTDPHDAVSTATNILSANVPRITIQPLANNQQTRELANNWEKNLEWQLINANKRRHASLIRDIVQSALLYHMVAAQVIDLDVQLKEKESAEAGTSRLKAMRRYGRFMVNTYNPRDVHARFSNVMLECVVLVQQRPAQEIVDEFGAEAKNALREYLDPKNPAWVTLYDYWDYENRCVWCLPSDQYTITLPEQGDGLVIKKPQEHNLSFMPWVVRSGGSSLEKRVEDQYHPLLYPVLTAGLWINQNISESLMGSEVVTHAASQRIAITALDPENPPEVDYGDPSRPLVLRQGEQAQQLQPPAIDRGQAEITDRLSKRISNSTLAQVLQGSGELAGEAFASLNLRTQTALGALRPYKELSEYAIAEVSEKMLLWVEKSGQPLQAYGRGKEDLGAEYAIDPATIDPESLYISCELTPDVPTDRQAKINTASIAVQSLWMSRERGLEYAGETDPQGVMKQYWFERLLENKLNIAMQSEMAMSQLQIQQMAQQAAAEAQMVMQQQQAAMQPPGIPGAEGAGFNPAQGGQPAQMMQPGATFEGQMGMTRGGAPTAETISGGGVLV